MDKFITYLLPGLFTGAAYAIAASGLVLTYTTTRVFNIAHGAFGMVLAFVFWDFSVRQGMPIPLALFLVLFVVAPAIGLFIQRFVARNLGDSPVSVSLVVTVGLFVACVGAAQQIWPAGKFTTTPRSVPPFFPGKGLHVAGTIITAHQMITIACSILVALGLFLLLNKTRIGTAMRASVDNPELLKLFGGNPNQVAALSWMIGMSLAGLAGILLVSAVGLDYYQLTLLVINAYAAAMVGKLKSLPLTFAGAMALGLTDSMALGYLPSSGGEIPLLHLSLGDLRPVVPPLFLFVAIILLPQAQLRVGQVKGIIAAPVPTLSRSVLAGAGFLVFTLLVVRVSSPSNLLLVGTAATYGIVMLSLVLLTGYGGHVSLAQLTFAGVGALAYIKLDQPNLGGLLLASLIAAAVGGLVALPVIRLTGLYLALSTLAFAVLMDKLVFQDDQRGFGYGGALAAKRLSILGHTISSTSGYVWVMSVFLVAVGIVLLAVRRGVVGRMLIAMRDSPAACGTLGLDQRWFRVGLFAASAGVAGLAGALYSGLRGTVGASDFQALQSLPLLLLAVVFGVTSVTGATLGGIGLMLLPVEQSNHPGIAGLIFAIIGVGAILLARDPNGLANQLFRLGRLLTGRVTAQVRRSLPELGMSSAELDAAAAATVVPAGTGSDLGEPVYAGPDDHAHLAHAGHLGHGLEGHDGHPHDTRLVPVTAGSNGTSTGRIEGEGVDHVTARG